MRGGLEGHEAHDAAHARRAAARSAHEVALPHGVEPGVRDDHARGVAVDGRQQLERALGRKAAARTEELGRQRSAGRGVGAHGGGGAHAQRKKCGSFIDGVGWLQPEEME